MTRRLSLLRAVGLLASLVACGDQAVTTTTAVMDLEYATHSQESLTLDMFVSAQPGGAPIVLHLPGIGETGPPMTVVEPLVESGVIVGFVRMVRPTAGATTLLADHGVVARAHFVPAWSGSDGAFGQWYPQEPDPDLWEFLSSSIGSNPRLEVRLIHGASDQVVPPEMASVFAAVLDAAGYDVQVETFEGGHTLPVDLAVSTIMEVVGS